MNAVPLKFLLLHDIKEERDQHVPLSNLWPQITLFTSHPISSADVGFIKERKMHSSNVKKISIEFFSMFPSSSNNCIREMLKVIKEREKEMKNSL